MKTPKASGALRYPPTPCLHKLTSLAQLHSATSAKLGLTTVGPLNQILDLLPVTVAWILNYHTWNTPKKYTSRIFTACRSDWYTSWECSCGDNSELSYWKNYNGSQWVFMIFPLSEIYRRLFWNKYWFAIRSQFDPLHWVSMLKWNTRNATPLKSLVIQAPRCTHLCVMCYVQNCSPSGSSCLALQ